MFGLAPLQLALCLLVLILLEVPLFWAAAALADAPPLGPARTFAVALGVAAVWVAVAAALGWGLGLLAQPLASEPRSTAFALGLLALAVSWAVPAVLYAPLLRVSFPRGLKMALLQVLLRGFLYVLIAAAVMVVLAVLQIVSVPTGS